MASDADPANLISYRKPDCQRSCTNAIHSQHTQPARQWHRLWHDAQPATAWHSTAQRTGMAQHEPKKSLFYREGRWHDRGGPWCPTRAAPNAENPSPQKNTTFMQCRISPEKLPISLFCPMQLRWPLLIKCCNHPLDFPVMVFCNLVSFNYRLR